MSTSQKRFVGLLGFFEKPQIVIMIIYNNIIHQWQKQFTYDYLFFHIGLKVIYCMIIFIQILNLAMQAILTISYTCRVAQKDVVQSIYKPCKYNCPNGRNCA
jgi:hypothetical protein